MKKAQPLLVCLFLLFLAAPLPAEVNIPPECRIPNRPPGCCMWCALETLARHQHIRALYGLTEKNSRRACIEDLEEVLTDIPVRYRIQYRGSFETKILRDALSRNRAAVVGFRELIPGKGGHVVTLVDFGPEQVRVIDSNDADGRVRTMSRDRFLYWWDGFVLVLDPAR